MQGCLGGEVFVLLLDGNQGGLEQQRTKRFYLQRRERKGHNEIKQWDPETGCTLGQFGKKFFFHILINFIYPFHNIDIFQDFMLYTLNLCGFQQLN
jgi:hypothetical protein